MNYVAHLHFDDAIVTIKGKCKMSLGEDRVRIKFNPSADDKVSILKQKAAEFIDLCESLRNSGSADKEQQRLWALAQTHAEDAAMWAVKAATF